MTGRSVQEWIGKTTDNESEHDCEACGDPFALEDGETLNDHTWVFPDRSLKLCGLCMIMAMAAHNETEIGQ